MMPEQTSSQPRPRTVVGEGVPKREEPAEEEEKTEEELKWENERPGVPKWHKEPTFEDQYTNQKYRNTHKLGPRTFRAFVVPDKEADLNALLARAVPAGAPQIIVSDTKAESCGEKWSILVVFNEVLYKKLLKTE